jgi:cell division protein FtsQ
VPVTAPADRRFLRAQVKPGRRHAPWRTWLRLAVVAGLAVALAGVATWTVVTVLRAPALRISRIEVSGTEHLSKTDVLALLNGLRGQNILRVRLDEYRRRVLASPWVADATISRSLPATVVVRIVERRPMAIGRAGETLFLVDDQGDEIDEYGPRYADFDLPIVDGLARGTARADDGNRRRVQLVARLMADVRARPELATRISQVDVSDPRDAVVMVDEDTARVRLGDERFLERLQSYVELAPTLHSEVPAIEYVDLRFGERVYVGSQAGAAPVKASGKASATASATAARTVVAPRRAAAVR